ncbi:MAG: DUF2752 domain-containing protein [Actinobacteria bacterium]|nr:MAG: DUF2752 domain-containing protein [Actinomycetota bacterium]
MSMTRAWRDRLLLAAPLLAVIGLSMVTPDADGPTICPFANVTGIACPGCGMTRAAGFLMRGDLAAALTYHPLVVLMALQAIAGWAWFVLRRGNRVKPMSNRVVTAILVGTGVSLLAVWLLRLSMGSLPPV